MLIRFILLSSDPVTLTGTVLLDLENLKILKIHKIGRTLPKNRLFRYFLVQFEQNRIFLYISSVQTVR